MFVGQPSLGYISTCGFLLGYQQGHTVLCSSYEAQPVPHRASLDSPTEGGSRLMDYMLPSQYTLLTLQRYSGE